MTDDDKYHSCRSCVCVDVKVTLLLLSALQVFNKCSLYFVFVATAAVVAVAITGVTVVKKHSEKTKQTKDQTHKTTQSLSLSPLFPHL